MKRTIIKIDESICNGCGSCIGGCHEGALQLIDNKARIISDLFCDGLGACIGECPIGAIELEEREAEPYDERAVMERIAPKGERTIVAHLVHLRDHNEMEFFNQGLAYLQEKGINVTIPKIKDKASCGSDYTGGRETSFTVASAILASDGHRANSEMAKCETHNTIPNHTSFSTITNNATQNNFTQKPINNATPKNSTNSIVAIANNEQQPLSQLRQWPVQLHLLNPESNYFKGADVVLSADCVAYSYADFHNNFIKCKAIAIACPKLDSGKEIYVKKLQLMIDTSLINSLTVVIMEVPCCKGLLSLVHTATTQAKRKIPIKLVVISIHGEIIRDEWL